MKDCGTAAVPASAGGSPSLCAAVGDSLVEAINSREATLRLASMQALGSLRYPFALQALTQQFGYYQRGEAAEAALEGLAGIAHPSSVPLFAELAAGGDPGIRRRAVEGLGRSGDRRQLAVVERVAASDRSPEVQLAAVFASQRLAGQARPGRLVAALANPALRALAQAYLVELSPSGASALAASLQDPDPATRAMVADVLGFSGDARVVPALEAAARDADAGAARAANRALARLRLAAAAPKP
jgi:HEAT repeat protein